MKNKESKLLKFLYKTFLGRLLLKLLVNPFFSKIIGAFLNTRLSKIFIKKTIVNNNINMSEYEQTIYKSFNDFFTREKAKLNIDFNRKSLISPCDAELMVYKINDDSIFEIKNSKYNVSNLINDNDLAKEFANGYFLVFRLGIKNYHKYCYIDNGIKGRNIFINGKLHTVRPISLDTYKVYQTNCREYTILQTENFGKAIQVEVGALLVGKIINYHQEYKFKRGEQKGLFKYGGSTICLLLKKNTATIDNYILENSKESIETSVVVGQKIGISNLKRGN